MPVCHAYASPAIEPKMPFFFIYMDFSTGQLPTWQLGSLEQAGTIQRKSVHPREKSQSLTFSSRSGIHHFHSVLFVSGELLDLDDPWEEWMIECHDTDPEDHQCSLQLVQTLDRLLLDYLFLRHLLRKIGIAISFCGPLRSAGFPGGSAGKESACNAKDPGLIPWLGRSPGEGKGYPLQCCGLENSMHCTVAKSRTRLGDFHLRPAPSARILPVSTPRRVFFRHLGALLWKLNHQGRQDPQLPVSAPGQESKSYQSANTDDFTTLSNLPQHPPIVSNWFSTGLKISTHFLFQQNGAQFLSLTAIVLKKSCLPLWRNIQCNFSLTIARERDPFRSCLPLQVTRLHVHNKKCHFNSF